MQLGFLSFFAKLLSLICWRALITADETETINENEEVEEEVTNGVTNINMDDQAEGDKKKPRRRGKKKETKEQEPEPKGKGQTNPPSVPIHKLFPTSELF